MPAWNQFVKKYALEAEDLPSPHGPNVMVIDSIDTEEYQNPQSRENRTRHLLYFVGWNVPLRLNNTRIKVIESMFGPNTEDAIGKRVVLVVAAENQYGQVKTTIHIHPFVCDQTATPATIPARFARTDNRSLSACQHHGVPIATPGPAAGAITGAYQFRYPSSQQQPHSTGAVAPTGKCIGAEAAANLILMLRERKRDWQWLVSHLTKIGMGHLVQGVEPPACDEAIKAPAWNAIRDLPIVAAIQDREAARASLMATWSPPEAREVVDQNTGEVKFTPPPGGQPKPATDIPGDDIPF